MRRMKASQFEALPTPRDAVVFLGDSITEGGSWHEWFPHATVVNRGIGGDTTDGVLHRLPAAVGASTTQLFLLIGTNDLTLKRTPVQIISNLSLIVAGITELAPSAEIVVQSVMPRNRKYRDRILELNVAYEEIAAKAGASYLDLWGVLADQDGALQRSLTQDQLHLNGSGYGAWVSELGPMIVGGADVPHRREGVRKGNATHPGGVPY